MEEGQREGEGKRRKRGEVTSIRSSHHFRPFDTKTEHFRQMNEECREFPAIITSDNIFHRSVNVAQWDRIEKLGRF